MFRYILLSAFTLSTFAICQKWSGPQVIGKLNTDFIDESSGIAISEKYSDRMYNINDSGSGPVVFTTKLNGQDTKQIKINNYRPYDTEDLSLGPCMGESCLFIADIGDNKKVRDYISIIAIPESKMGEGIEVVDPLFKMNLKYPHAKHNAEAMVVHPSGDIYILTKEKDKENRQAFPAKLFKVERNDIVSKGVGSAVLKEVATFDIPYLVPNHSYKKRVVTGMDISKDGRTLLILTYKAVLEIDINFDSLIGFDLRNLDPGKDFSLLATKDLEQQEAIAYGVTGRDFIYTTEVESKSGISEIVRHQCEQ